MKSRSPGSLQFPVWKDVDILVVGSTSAAVTAALAAAENGSRVAVLSDETYFGSDLAGALRLWACERKGFDEVVSAAFATSASEPARPAALKRSMEQALMRAGIPFLFGVRPIGLLRSEQHVLQGALIAARTSPFGITCRTIIDATPQGIIARMAGIPMAKRPETPASVSWRVFSDREPSAWPGTTHRIEPDYHQLLKDGPKQYQAYELQIAREELGMDQRAVEHEARALLIDESVWVTADVLGEDIRDVHAGFPLQCDIASLTDLSLEGASSIWLANGLAPLSDAGLPNYPDFLAALGRRVGALAAKKTAPSIFSTISALLLTTGGDSMRPYSFAGAFLRDSGSTLQIDRVAFPEWEEFDVVVAGGGTAGAPAAIAAARAGARTLCLEMAHGFGGVGTLGLISSYWFGNKVGFTTELNDLVSEFDTLSRAKNGNMWHPGVKSGLYHRLLRDAGGTGWLGSFACGVSGSGNRPEGLLVSTPYGCGFVSARCFVDATGNADLAAAAGASCRLMGSRHAAVQGTGISPRVHPSVLHQNSDHTFVEENDPLGITHAHMQAREKYPHDFETMPFVNSRERRQIHGDLEVSPLDILTARTFPDTVFTASSNFDTHGFIIHPVFMVAPPDHKPLQAHVPLRCMLPKGIEGILVTGLGMSAHRDALPVIRMQADVQNQGYAAGLLAAQCSKSGENFREIDVRAFQQRLVAEGIISSETALHQDSFPLPASAVEEALRSDLSDVKHVAILFANSERSREGLLRLLRDTDDADRQDKAALILGLVGCSEPAGYLKARLSDATWDEGWNYRGMGQFGSSMSRLDAMIIAFGRTGDPQAGGVLAKLAERLGKDAEFSHCRAIALAAANLRDPGLALALERLLNLPGFCGHAFRTVGEMLADSDGDPTSTTSRNLSLREIYVARGLFLSGDPHGRGRAILETYSGDLRGHFARHALAVLEGGMSSSDPLELA